MALTKRSGTDKSKASGFCPAPDQRTWLRQCLRGRHHEGLRRGQGTFYHYFECKEDVVRELSRNTAMATIERAIDHEGDVIERCCFYFGEIYKDCMWSGVRSRPSMAP